MNSTLLPILATLLLLLASSQVSAHHCLHDNEAHQATHHGVTTVPQNYALPSGNSPAPSRRLLASSQTSPIRVHVDFSTLDNDPQWTCYATGDSVKILNAQNQETTATCAAKDVLTAAKRTAIVDTVNVAVGWLRAWLEVAPVQGALNLTNNTRCGSQGGVAVPGNYLASQGGSPNTDLVLLISAHPTSHLGNTIAYASMCQKDQNGRAIAGQLNFGPGAVDPAATGVALDRANKVALHEIIHVLGFSKDRFSEWNITQPIKEHNYTQGSMTHTISYLDGPQSVAWARDHFNCPTLLGPEIENGGSSGTAGSHWETRLFNNALMTGATGTLPPVITGLTFAALEDSGWYKRSASFKAETLTWGYRKGCAFATGRCDAWTGYGYTQCSAPATLPQTSWPSTCTQDRTFKGYCPVQQYTCGTSDTDAICTDPWYQYYANRPTVGGTNALADFCAFAQPFSNGNCLVAPANPSQFQDARGENYNNASRCFESKLITSEYTVPSTASGTCFQTACVADATDPNVVHLHLRAGNSWFECTAAGDTSVVGFVGTLTCPAATEVCTAQRAKDTSSWPTISEISPSKGSITGGTKITVKGTHLASMTAVHLNGQACSSVSAASDGNSITCTTPAYSGQKDKDVKVGVAVSSSMRGASKSDVYTFALESASSHLSVSVAALVALVLLASSLTL